MTELISALEAVLFASGDSLPIERLSLVFGVEESEIYRAADELTNRYQMNKSGICILRLDNRLQMCSEPRFAPYVIKTLEQRKPPMLSQAALETLSIVAYYQPVTQSVIEKMRGVDSSYSVNSLLERGLIEVCGKLDAPGRPRLFRTTDIFLRTVGIHSLSELPPLPEIHGSEGAEQLQKAIEKLQREQSGEQTMIEQFLYTDAEDRGD